MKTPETTKWDQFKRIISGVVFYCDMHLAADSRLFIHFFKKSKAFEIVTSLSDREKEDFLLNAEKEMDDIVSRKFDPKYCNPCDAQLCALFISIVALDSSRFIECYYQLGNIEKTCSYLPRVIGITYENLIKEEDKECEETN